MLMQVAQFSIFRSTFVCLPAVGCSGKKQSAISGTAKVDCRLMSWVNFKSAGIGGRLSIIR